MEESIFSPSDPDTIGSVSRNFVSEDEEHIDNHKLYDKWCLWAHLPHNTDWSLDSYIKITTFSTIEETIALFDSFPNMLIKNCMLFLMKDGINPMWEDKKNINGGCFSYKISNKSVVEAWKNLSYTLIGYSLSENKKFEDNITGITISPKKNFCVIKVWTTNCNFKDPYLINNIVNISNEDCIFKKHN